MKRTKGFVLITVLLLAVLVCGVSATTLALGTEPEEIVIDETCGPTTYPLNDHPDVLYKDNAGPSVASASNSGSDWISVNDVVNEAAVSAAGGEVVSSSYSTYSTFLNDVSAANSRSTLVGDNRVVLVVEIYYPDGFEHPKVGLIENCVAVGIYDAETGDYLGGEYNAIEGSYNS